ncbi:MAG TPA: Gldg family protein, partial [Polyangia bacterium]
MALAHKKTASVVYAAGLASVYLGERVLGPGRTSAVAMLLGLAAVVTAMILGLRRGNGRPAGRVLPALYGLGLLALVLHLSRGDLPALLGRRALDVSMPKLDGALAVLWPAILLVGTLPVLLVEFALAGMARSPLVDGKRVRAAMLSGLGIAFALVFCFAVAYVAAERNVKADLSFFRTARASAVTKQLVAALDQPIEVTLFYPPGNEVAEELAGYFADLVRASNKLTVVRADQAVDPAKAKALGVTGNGAVAFARGAQHEQLQIPVKLEGARSKLRVLDQDVHKRILSMARGKRTAYLVQGHEERSFGAPHDDEPTGTLSLLRELLQGQNLDVRELGLAQGLGNEVPADAAMVMLVGPQRAMLGEESAALARYFRRGGRLLMTVDPENAPAASPILAALSLQISNATLANDRIFWARTHQKADRVGIVPTNYSSHSALASQAPYGTQMPVVLLGAGALGKSAIAPDPAPTVDFIIRTEPSTWEDKNKNLEFDSASEERKSYPVAAAVTLRKPASSTEATQDGRAFVVGDSDVFSDLLIRNRANALLA